MVDVPALEAGVLVACEFESHHPHSVFDRKPLAWIWE